MDIVFKVIVALAGVAVLLAVVGLQSLTRGTTVRRLRAPGDGDGPPRPRTRSSARRCRCSPRRRSRPATASRSTPTATRRIRGCGRTCAPRSGRSRCRCTTASRAGWPTSSRQILLERARAGVRDPVPARRVRLGRRSPKEYIEELEAGGVEVAAFRPTRWYQLYKVYHRSHIRVVVIDGMIGYTGGFGIDDKWFGDGRHEDQWRDTNARFTGPAVLQHQATFAAGWAEATGDAAHRRPVLPAARAKYSARRQHRPRGCCTRRPRSAARAPSATTRSPSAARSSGSASRNSYFVPSENFCELLVAARRSAAWTCASSRCNEDGDVKSTYYAGRAHVRDAARRRRAHLRVPAGDDARQVASSPTAASCSAGTMNFDNRSMAFNDETTLLAVDDRPRRADGAAVRERPALFARDHGRIARRAPAQGEAARSGLVAAGAGTVDPVVGGGLWVLGAAGTAPRAVWVRTAGRQRARRWTAVCDFARVADFFSPRPRPR